MSSISTTITFITCWQTMYTLPVHIHHTRYIVNVMNTVCARCSSSHSNTEEKDHVPFAGKLHIFDSFFFYVCPIIEAACVGQVHQQTHLNLRRGEHYNIKLNISITNKKI